MIECLSDMIDSQEYQIYASETAYSLQDHCLDSSYDTDPDTMDEYNEAGMFGVTHNDIIENQRRYLNNNKKELFGNCECDVYNDTCEACCNYAYIDKEIDELHDWHLKNGSLEEII